MTQRSSILPPMSDPLGFFLTWPTYGTWLPGDERGWVEYRRGWQVPSDALHRAAADRMTEDVCLLTLEQRQIVEQTIRDHCDHRQWELFAASCRSNHVHVVVAARVAPKEIYRQFKAWCTRRLKRHESDSPSVNSVRQKWWAERGSARYLNDETSLERAVLYVTEAQDRKHRDQEMSS